MSAFDVISVDLVLVADFCEPAGETEETGYKLLSPIHSLIANRKNVYFLGDMDSKYGIVKNYLKN